ncbi:hypothetical protein [Streptomyces sp. L2]|uniref:hypothetical protein n=1 Tax=Streptomyces sp. L2 TaxID=2162665 RepID=UPI001010E7F0|nr:hypothetical protein [Streptomyces sp. L2]
MRAAARSTGTFLVAAAMLSGCGSAPARPSQEEIITAATVKLTDSCLRHQGLTAPRPGQAVPAAERQRVTDALFGTGPAQLSLTLPTGYVVRAHTDGCLAAAQRRLYGDQAAWFRTSVVVDNLKPEADYTHRSLTQVRARHRAELAAWQRLRAHALTEATALLSNSATPGRSS